ncbi:monodehydroascorbate reductase 5, chlorplastic [Selaginella moellendorffii]|uniref:monodehydroascorbate reductase 5, chlorplastic n=1 Tax=Selaginella moellendorffii TaxID=88036 RepID=UPI000D1CB46A|nr:monodehydroascorbate reductase 5, chlorplastic [Selaginella moellendorffii]|eukprot:XP_024529636.1 monodehydroascorbate reductase 5, chlorplastic [Selaginella moellendorffii]
MEAQGFSSCSMASSRLFGAGARFSHSAIVLPAPRHRFASRRSGYAVAAKAHLNENREYVIVGGGNSAGYLAHAFAEKGLADGKLCIVAKETVPPYERPALTKAYLFPLDEKPARLPGFHTCVGSGWERQTPEWYKEKGIELLQGTTVSGLDIAASTLETSSGDTIKYGNLIIATGCTAARLPEKIGGNLPGVHYIREVADADSLVASLKGAKKAVIIGGGYIGLEVSAATSSWNIDTTVVFPEPHVMFRLFTPSIAKHYEKFYEDRGVKFVKGPVVSKIVSGSSGRVEKVELSDGTTLEADVVVVGIGAKPAIGPFVDAGLATAEGGIQVDGQFRTSVPGISAIGDVAAFPLKMYGRTTRVEHVDHARKSALHCANALLETLTDPYDYLPFFYSRVFENSKSSRKLWWQFYGDNVGESVEFGDFNNKYGAFWIDDGRLKGVFLESGSPEEFALLPKLARAQPSIDKARLQSVSSVEQALEIASKQVGSPPATAAAVG